MAYYTVLMCSKLRTREKGVMNMKNKGIKKRICCFMVMLMLFALSSIACNKKEPSSIAEDSNPVQSSFSDVYKLYMEEANQKIKEITIEKAILEEIGKHGGTKEINEHKTRLAFDLNDLDHDGIPELMMFKKYFFLNNQSLSEVKIATALELRILTCENGISKEIFSDTFYDADDLMGKSPAACLQYCIDKETGDKFILWGGIKVSTRGDNSFYYSVLELQENNKVVEKEIFRLYEEHAYAYMDDPKAKHYYKYKGKEVTKEDYEKSLANYEESFARIDIFNYEINRAVPLLNLLEIQDYWQDAVPLDEERIAKILYEKGKTIVVHENPFDASKINISE